MIHGQLHETKGRILAVQEGRFKMICDDLVVRTFILAHSARAEPRDLQAYVREEMTVRVRYRAATGLIAAIADRITPFTAEPGN